MYRDLAQPLLRFAEKIDCLMEKTQNKYWSQFYELADNPQYLYVYIDVSFGWGIKPSKRYHFLYDIKAKKAQCIDEVGKEVELSFSHKKIKVEKMFKFDPDIRLLSSDTTTYYIFLKSGHRERTLFIDSFEKSKFKPFLWILNTVDKDNECLPKKTGLIRRLYNLICKSDE